MSHGLARAALCVLVAGGAASAALAQQGSDPPCVLDKCLSPPGGGSPDAARSAPAPAEAPRSPVSRGSIAPGSFDFYVLALSWSPGFCATGGAERAPAQCSTGRGLGFVVHGLWPQNNRGYPSDCGPAGRFPSRAALDEAETLYPDRGLARHEWLKHGTCTGQSPTDYFADVKQAREAITIPDSFKAPATDGTWVPADVARAFTAANPGLRTDQMAVTCRQGVMQEVRLCLSKDLRGFVPCPEVARGSCRTRDMNVPGLR